MHLYSNSSSTIALISLLITSEMFPACFSCNNNFNLLHKLSGSDDRIVFFENPKAAIAGDFSKFSIDLSL